MTLTTRLRDILGTLKNPSKAELKEALLQLNITLDDLAHLPPSANGKPYNREILYKDEEVEVLVMNWSQLECAPHDHGHSQGWIQVLNGSVINSVYEVNGNQLPEEIFQQSHQKGKLFYAPKKGVHKMKAAHQNQLTTLHLYSPPISGMIVYDLNKCAACVVSDDCGAWWPEEQKQKVKEIQLQRGRDVQV